MALHTAPHPDPWLLSWPALTPDVSDDESIGSFLRLRTTREAALRRFFGGSGRAIAETEVDRLVAETFACLRRDWHVRPVGVAAEDWLYGVAHRQLRLARRARLRRLATPWRR